MSPSASLNANYPITQLSFVVLTAERERFRPELEELMQGIVASREWVVEPPGLFDPNAEDGRNGRGLFSGVPRDPNDDLNTPDPRMLGGYLDMYSATFAPLPYELDARHFEEATALIHLLERFSIKHGLEIEVYFDHELIGDIIWGLQNESLRVGLFEEWEVALEEQKEQHSQSNTLRQPTA